MRIIVTGTNRGLGKKLAQILLKDARHDLIFTTRKKPEENTQLIEEWRTNYPKSDFTFKTLDLGSEESVIQFIEEIKEQKLEVDVLINNAALGFDNGQQVPKVEYAKPLLEANVTRTIQLTEGLLPFLSKRARIINVSSKLGGLKFQPERVQKAFSSEVSPALIEKSVADYIGCCEKGKMDNWFKSSYGTSKMMLNAWSRFILKNKLQNEQVSIVMSPGHCRTDMGGEGGAHTAESGAQTIYDCIDMKDPSSDVFYHRGVEHQFVNCGPEVNSVNLPK